MFKTSSLSKKSIKLFTINMTTACMLAAATLCGSVCAAEYSRAPTTDATLIKTLPGFRNATAHVNGTTLHYVIGGKGRPLVLLPGWPQTWWAYHKIMPDLSKHYQVIAVDLRGMGSSAKPTGGYDKKNMAKDIHELLLSLGHGRASIVGHDIGSQVAWSFGANFPEATEKLVLIDLPHLDESVYSWPILPTLNKFGDKVDPAHVFAWWFAFHQVKLLPEKLLAGRVHLEQEWFFTYVMKDESALTPMDRAVYANAYQGVEAIRASNSWFQAFPQDVEDQKSYGKLNMPVLGLGSTTYSWLQSVLAAKATQANTVKINSGHLIPEEAPRETLKEILGFLAE